MKDIKLLENCDGGANTRRKRYSEHGQIIGFICYDLKLNPVQDSICVYTPQDSSQGQRLVQVLKQ